MIKALFLVLQHVIRGEFISHIKGIMLNDDIIYLKSPTIIIFEIRHKKAESRLNICTI